MSFIDVRDIATISSKILANNGVNQQYVNKSYDITGSDALSYSQAAEILSSEADKNISYVDVTE